MGITNKCESLGGFRSSFCLHRGPGEGRHRKRFTCMWRIFPFTVLGDLSTTFPPTKKRKKKKEKKQTPPLNQSENGNMSTPSPHALNSPIRHPPSHRLTPPLRRLHRQLRRHLHPAPLLRRPRGMARLRPSPLPFFPRRDCARITPATDCRLAHMGTGANAHIPELAAPRLRR